MFSRDFAGKLARNFVQGLKVHKLYLCDMVYTGHYYVNLYLIGIVVQGTKYEHQQISKGRYDAEDPYTNT